MAVLAEQHFAPPPGSPAAGRLSWLAADFFAQPDALPQQVCVRKGRREGGSWPAETHASAVQERQARVWL